MPRWDLVGCLGVREYPKGGVFREGCGIHRRFWINGRQGSRGKKCNSEGGSGSWSISGDRKLTCLTRRFVGVQSDIILLVKISFVIIQRFICFIPRWAGRLVCFFHNEDDAFDTRRLIDRLGGAGSLNRVTGQCLVEKAETGLNKVGSR